MINIPFLSKITKGDERSVAVKKNVFFSFIIKGVSILISLLLVPLTIGYVSAELYGVWLTLSSVMVWLHFFDIGFTQGLKNKLTESLAQGDFVKGKALVSTTYVMLALIFVPLGIVLQFIVPLVDWCSLLNINVVYSDQIVKAISVLCAVVCLQMVISVITSIVSAYQKVALSSLLTVIGQVFAFAVVIILTKTVAPSLIALAIALSAVPLLVMFVGSIYLFSSQFHEVSPSIWTFDKSMIKDLFNLGFKFFIINIQFIVLYQSTTILISYISSPLVVTSYGIAYSYLNLAMMAYQIITAPLWPAYTDAYTKKDYYWMRNTRKKMIKLFLLSTVACFIMVLVSPIAYKIWVGDKASVPFCMSCLVGLYVCSYCWMSVNGTLISGMGKIQIATICAIIGMVVHIPFSFLLSRVIGPYGVIVSMTLINIFYSIFYVIQIDKLFNGTAKGIWVK